MWSPVGGRGSSCSGLGDATATAIVEAGGRVVIADLATSDGETTAKRLGDAATFVPVDITDEAGLNTALDAVVSKHGGLHGLVCTPAINVRKSILKYSGEEFDRVVKVNLRGNFNVLMATGRIMTAQKSGSIVLFSSIQTSPI